MKAYFELGREGEEWPPSSPELDFLRSMSRGETRTLLFRENDARNAIVTIPRAATESQDWAECCCACIALGPSAGFRTEINDHQPGEEAGIKSATYRDRIRLWFARRRDWRAPARPYFSLRSG